MKKRSSSRPAALSPFALQITASQGAQFVPPLRKHLLAAHPLLKTALRELSVALVGDAKMAELHERFLGIAGPTDVLTFELDYDDYGSVIAGEVVVCVPEARRQAKKQGSTAGKELLLYALHGMLHLGGFDDRTDPDYRKMHRKEDEILTALGVGPVFAAARSAVNGAG